MLKSCSDLAPKMLMKETSRVFATVSSLTKCRTMTNQQVYDTVIVIVAVKSLSIYP